MVAGLGNVQLRNQHLALLWQREVFITSFMTNKDLKNNGTEVIRSMSGDQYQ